MMPGSPAVVNGSTIATRGRTRLIAAAIALPCWAALITAVFLRPDSRGYDTHTQLHLPPCTMMQTSGIPCPTCGMTTAFAHMAKGRILPAARAQAFGAVLFVLTGVAGIVYGLHALIGRPKFVRPRLWWVWAALAGTGVGWAIKAGIGLSNGALPL